MKASLSWLNTYVTTTKTAEELAAALTMAGLEVEAVTDRYAYLDTVVVGRIIDINPHPNADKLNCCDVDTGDRTFPVVCGAPNARLNGLYPMALPGTHLPNGMAVRKNKIRGEISEGMLCSEGELSLGPDFSGLLALDSGLTAGTRLNIALDYSDPVFEIGLTPNRPDCLGIIGIAREVAVIEQTGLKQPEIELPESTGDITKLTSVTIESPDHCPRYAARLVKNLRVKPSPFWLQDKLLSVGSRPINNLVDITNFVMLESGQPLHAFDFDQLEERRIVVRTARDGEKFTTLDQKERTLTDETLMICDGVKPVAIGGVMGGLNSEIEDTTTNVLIESAYFSPASVRKTSKKLGLPTDASHRFERGVDPAGTLFALDRAAQLITDLGEGELVGGTIDEKHELPESPDIPLRVSSTNRVLGLDLTAGQMTTHLSGIEFDVRVHDEDTLMVKAPSFRGDVSRPADLMEEIARLSGYDNIPTTFPEIPATAVKSAKILEHRRDICRLMAGFGFTEAINYSFIRADACDHLRLPAADKRRHVVRVLNPLSEDQSVMRTSLVPGLLETVSRNLSHRANTIRMFETGRIFIGKGADQLPTEYEIVAGIWTGRRREDFWQEKNTDCDFFDLKGIVEALITGLNVSGINFTALPEASCSYYQTGHTARISAGDHHIGVIGRILPAVCDHFGIDQPVFIFELDLNTVSPLIPDYNQYVPLPKFPATSRDVTLIVDKSSETDRILNAVVQFDEPLVEDVRLFDVFEGDPIQAGRKSISFRITYRSARETLLDESVNTLHKKISDRLLAQFDADLPA
ncbi:MAG: phenylalanine--tRNA ligase subunit beta [Desulfobacteraceae bacterium]|nr:phenylalanine--tRNA ligase subunit beta [Desulfobacteraceae bacterium]